MNALLFSDFERVKDFMRGKRVVVVGSGPTGAHNKPGVIDGYDVIVRVNNYKTKGVKSGIPYDYSASLGSRTDVFYSFFGSSIQKTREELIADGVKLCMSKLPNSKPFHSAWAAARGKEESHDYRPNYRRRESFWFCPTYVPTDEHFMELFESMGRHQPTTGFSAIMDMSKCEPKELYITGFDFFASGVHNVDERWRRKNEDDPHGHDPEREKRAVIELSKKPFVTLDPYLQGLK